MGNGRGAPLFGLKPQEMVDLELLTPRAGIEFDEAVKVKSKRRGRQGTEKEEEEEEEED